VEIPDNVEVFLMITDREVHLPKSRSQKQLDAFNRFVSAIHAINDEPLTDADFVELESNRANLGRMVAI